jgi:L-ascorbate metabolism protein UlaG (beta-lactamase superfamily)
MDSTTRYAWKASTLIEALVDSWPAWSYLMSPLTSALHAETYQFPVLRSYLSDAELHVSASRDPDLFGGPWVDVPTTRRDDVAHLLHESMARRADSLAFANTFMEFHRNLVTQARGQSLEPYYDKVPRVLRGYVELLYDYFNRPYVRLHEPLLYKSPYYDEALQSLRLSKLEDDRRPFFMSTPRLPRAGDIESRRPFRDDRTREIYALDRRSRPLGEILELLELKETSAPLLAPLLDDGPVRFAEPWTADAMRVRYLGHACTLIEWNGISVLTDPFVPVRPAAGGADRLSFRDIPEHIDVAVVTHNHQDHFSLECLLRLRDRIGCLVVPKPFRLLYGDVSLGLLARTVGFSRVVELEELETLELPGGGITAVPFHGEHADLAHGKNGYVVRGGNCRVWLAADSDCLDPDTYRRAQQICGPADALFVGTESVGGPLSWTNGCLLPARPEKEHENGRRYHGCSAATAISLMEAVGARQLYLYAMGLEPWMDHLLGLGMNEGAPQWKESEAALRQARARQVHAERLNGPRDIMITPTPRHATVGSVGGTADQFQF